MEDESFRSRCNRQFCEQLTEAIDLFDDYHRQTRVPLLQVLAGYQSLLQKIEEAIAFFSPGDEDLTTVCKRIYEYCVLVILDRSWVGQAQVGLALVAGKFNDFHQSLSPWAHDSFFVVATLAQNPWRGRVMSAILSGTNNVDKEEVDQYLTVEGQFILEHRLRILIQDGFHYHALNLSQACVDHPQLGGVPIFFETTCLLLHKLGKLDNIEAQVDQQSSLDHLVCVIRNMAEYCPAVASLLSRMSLRRAWSGSNAALTRVITRLWLDTTWEHCAADPQAFSSELASIHGETKDPIYLFYLADMVFKKIGSAASTALVPLCLNALTAPTVDLAEDFFLAASIDSGNVAICCLLYQMLEGDVRIQRLALLAVFFIAPSVSIYMILKDIFNRRITSVKPPRLSSHQQSDLVQCIRYFMPEEVSPVLSWKEVSKVCIKYLHKSKVYRTEWKLPGGNMHSVRVHLKSWVPLEEEPCRLLRAPEMRAVCYRALERCRQGTELVCVIQEYQKLPECEVQKKPCSKAPDNMLQDRVPKQDACVEATVKEECKSCPKETVPETCAKVESNDDVSLGEMVLETCANVESNHNTSLEETVLETCVQMESNHAVSLEKTVLETCAGVESTCNVSVEETVLETCAQMESNHDVSLEKTVLETCAGVESTCDVSVEETVLETCAQMESNHDVSLEKTVLETCARVESTHDVSLEEYLDAASANDLNCLAVMTQGAAESFGCSSGTNITMDNVLSCSDENEQDESTLTSQDLEGKTTLEKIGSLSSFTNCPFHESVKQSQEPASQYGEPLEDTNTEVKSKACVDDPCVSNGVERVVTLENEIGTISSEEACRPVKSEEDANTAAKSDGIENQTNVDHDKLPSGAKKERKTKRDDVNNNGMLRTCRLVLRKAILHPDLGENSGTKSCADSNCLSSGASESEEECNETVKRRLLDRGDTYIVLQETCTNGCDNKSETHTAISPASIEESQRQKNECVETTPPVQETTSSCNSSTTQVEDTFRTVEAHGNGSSQSPLTICSPPAPSVESNEVHLLAREENLQTENRSSYFDLKQEEPKAEIIKDEKTAVDRIELAVMDVCSPLRTCTEVNGVSLVGEQDGPSEVLSEDDLQSGGDREEMRPSEMINIETSKRLDMPGKSLKCAIQEEGKGKEEEEEERRSSQAFESEGVDTSRSSSAKIDANSPSKVECRDGPDEVPDVPCDDAEGFGAMSASVDDIIPKEEEKLERSSIESNAKQIACGMKPKIESNSEQLTSTEDGERSSESSETRDDESCFETSGTKDEQLKSEICSDSDSEQDARLHNDEDANVKDADRYLLLETTTIADMLPGRPFLRAETRKQSPALSTEEMDRSCHADRKSQRFTGEKLPGRPILRAEIRKQSPALSTEEMDHSCHADRKSQCSAGEKFSNGSAVELFVEERADSSECESQATCQGNYTRLYKSLCPRPAGMDSAEGSSVPRELGKKHAIKRDLSLQKDVERQDWKRSKVNNDVGISRGRTTRSHHSPKAKIQHNSDFGTICKTYSTRRSAVKVQKDPPFPARKVTSPRGESLFPVTYSTRRLSSGKLSAQPRAMPPKDVETPPQVSLQQNLVSPPRVSPRQHPATPPRVSLRQKVQGGCSGCGGMMTRQQKRTKSKTSCCQMCS